jgi:peptidoglycan/LPS O-acetylase OafA/YrhL
LEPVAASLEIPKSNARPQSKARSSYIPGLDAIRAIAFLMVFGAHGLPGISYYIPATLGVTIFFFLSGFLITTLLRKEFARTHTIALRDFYIRRTLRIFVPLYVVYGLVVATSFYVVHLPVGNWFGFLSMLFYFFNYTIALGTHAWLPIGMQVVWSLAVEEHFYILFPLIYLTMMRRRIPAPLQTRILVGFCLLELLWRFILWTVLHQRGGWTYVATDARLDSILWGCILALNHNPVFADLPLVSPRWRVPAFFLAIFFLFSTLAIRNTTYRDTLRYTLQALALYVIFNFVVGNIRHWSVRWMEWPPLRYLGWTSYVLYLSHAFILACTEIWFPNRLWLSSSTCFLLALAFATLTRYTLELPLQRLRARFRHVPEADPTAPDGHGLIA